MAAARPRLVHKAMASCSLHGMGSTTVPSVAAPAANFMAQAYTALEKLSTVKDEKSGNDKSINYGGGKDVDI